MFNTTRVKLATVLTNRQTSQPFVIRQIIRAVDVIHWFPPSTRLYVYGLPHVSQVSPKALGRLVTVNEVADEPLLTGKLSVPASAAALLYRANQYGGAISKTPIFTVLHELGHFIDHAVAQERQLGALFASEEPQDPFHEVAQLCETSSLFAWRRDELVRELARSARTPEVQVLMIRGLEDTLVRRELFACAYAQFITTRRQCPSDAKRELSDLRKKGWLDRRYWDEMDFKPIAKALETALSTYGLL